MKAIAISKPGGPEVLVATSLATPEAGDGEVLVQVAAAGVNRPDCMQRAGKYPPPPGAPDTPGLEIAGRIAAVGPNVARFKVGDAVCALVAGGGYAEYCLAPAVQCLPIPSTLSMEEAAAIPETFFTVWSNVFDRGRLKAGETLLVHGGASGIGTTAIQMGIARGAEVFVTVSNAEKAAACEKLGASLIINYQEQDFVEAVAAHTDGRGVDLILSMVGGDYIPRNISSLAPDGRLVQIAFLGGAPRNASVGIDFSTVMQKRLTLTGSTLRPRPIEFKAEIAKALEENVWPLIAQGRVRPLIYRTLPLEQAAQAHAIMERNEVIGKLVLTVDRT